VSARNAFHSNPENSILDAKRLVGRRMNDDDMKKHWPSKAIEKNGKPSITVKHKGLFVSFFSNIPGYSLTLPQTPEEISAMLSKMKEIALSR
jgi:heat shock protein 5